MVWAWLAKVESMGRSFSAYAPVVLASKLLTYARVILLTWVIGTDQFGVWGLGVMVFGIGSTILTLGSGQSVARYVSYYHARGQLRRFFRRAAVGICLVGAIATAGGLLASGSIAGLLSASREAAVRLSYSQRLEIVVLGLINGLLMALYLNLHSCIRAMRTFHLLAVVEVGYTVSFTAAALLAGWAWPTGVTVLWAHAASLALMLLAGGYAAHRALGQLSASGAAEEEPGAVGEEGDVVPQDGHVSAAELAEVEKGGPILGRLLRFGFVAMLATLAWQFGNHVSFFLTNRYCGTSQAGIYAAIRQFCQPAWILSGMVWGVVFSHLASHWESNKRQAAVEMVNITYKAVVVVLMTVTVLVLATGRWWRLLLQKDYQAQIGMLGGLLMFYQCSANLGLASIAAKLRERPVVIVAFVAAGVAVNVILGWMWIPSGGVQAAAQAAGIGMLVAVALGGVYLVASGFRAHPAAHVLALSPAVLLAPTPVVIVAWAGVLAVAAFTPLVFTAREKRALVMYVRSLGMRRGWSRP